MMKTGKIIVIDADKCTGCRACEMACSLKHFNVCGPDYSRIRVYRRPDAAVFMPVICRACDDAFCIKICPVNARAREDNGAIVTGEERCIGCKGCICGCPFGAAAAHPETGKIMNCDLCKDESGPWCVKACSMQGALKYVTADEAARAKAREWTKNCKDVFKKRVRK